MKCTHRGGYSSYIQQFPCGAVQTYTCSTCHEIFQQKPVMNQNNAMTSRRGGYWATSSVKDYRITIIENIMSYSQPGVG